MSWRDGELEFRTENTADGLIRATFRRPGSLPGDLATVVKRADESWEEEPCAPLGGLTCWFYGMIFMLKWRSITPVFALRSTMANGDLIRFFQGQSRRGRSKVLVIADDRSDGGSVFTVSGENFAHLRGELDRWRKGLTLTVAD